MIRRIILVIVGLALAVVLVAWTFSRPISDALFSQAINSRLAQSTEPMPGLHIYLCGTGSPLPDPTRSGPCLGILAGDRAFVVDPGEGAARRLSSMGFPIASTERVILTHLHSDHIDGLPGILLQAWVGGGRKEPLPISGPEGVQSVVDGVNMMFKVDSTFRTAHHGTEIADPAGYGAAAHTVALNGDAQIIIIDDDEVTLKMVPVSHDPVEPALSLRIDHAGRSVSFSGDTLYDERFVALSKGVDLMLHDAMQHKMIKIMENRLRAANPDSPVVKILLDIVDYHASPEDAARAASDAGAGALILTHVAPPLPTRFLYPAFLGEAAKYFAGEITVGEDGMIFNLKPK